MTSPTRTQRPAPRVVLSALRGVLGALVVAVVLSPSAAHAHPLGLPAFAQIGLTADGAVTIAWNASADDVAALARSIGVDVPRGQVLTRDQDAELASSDTLREALLAGVTVAQDGESCSGQVEVTSLVKDGARWRFDCPVPAQAVEVTISLLTGIDQRYRTLATAATADGPQRVMFTSTAPTHPLELAAASSPPPVPPAASADASSDGGPDQSFGGSLFFESQFVALIDRPGGAGALALGVLMALGIGALHGVAPGHGKAIAAAYLVGDRGRPRDAVLLGTVVALMHTWSVLALGYALYLATQRPATAALSAWLQLVSGVLVALLGGWLLVRRLRERRHSADHQHDHEHDHVTKDGDHPLSWRGLVTLGAAGGLLPSPSALLVVFTALAVGRIAYGLTLIAAFSLGLAVTVSVVGIAVVRGRDVITARMARSPRMAGALSLVPLVAAGAVVVFGMVVTGAAAAAVIAAR